MHNKDKMPLTPSLQRALDEIVAYAKAHDGNTPTYSELSRILGFKCRSSGHALVQRLEERGYIFVDRKSRARCIMLVDNYCPKCGEPL